MMADPSLFSTFVSAIIVFAIVAVVSLILFMRAVPPMLTDHDNFNCSCYAIPKFLSVTPGIAATWSPFRFLGSP